MSLASLMNKESSGVYFLPAHYRTAVESAATRQHYKVISANITEHSGIQSVLSQLGSALNFPIWYGANFDALFDCLTDPDWLPAKGHTLFINGISGLRTADPDDFTTLIDVFKAVAEARHDMLSPFWILLDTPARGIPTFPEA